MPGPREAALSLAPSLRGPGSGIRGVTINALETPGAAAALVQIFGEDSFIEGSFFGVDGKASRGFPTCLGLALNADGVRLGGTTDQERNIIAGQCPLVTIGANAVKVFGNRIGLNQMGKNPNAGSQQEMNVGGGIHVDGGKCNEIGGNDPGQGNVIAGVSVPIVLLSDGNFVQGNKIGTDPTGMITDPDGPEGTASGLGGVDGVTIREGDYNLIGGPGPVVEMDGVFRQPGRQRHRRAQQQ